MLRLRVYLESIKFGSQGVEGHLPQNLLPVKVDNTSLRTIDLKIKSN